MCHAVCAMRCVHVLVGHKTDVAKCVITSTVNCLDFVTGVMAVWITDYLSFKGKATHNNNTIYYELIIINHHVIQKCSTG